MRLLRRRRAMLSDRRATLDRVETITAFAKDMSEFLRTSEPTGSRAFIETVVMPGNAVVHYSVPMPYGSLIPGRNAEKMALNGLVLSTVKNGGPERLPGPTGKQDSNTSLDPCAWAISLARYRRSEVARTRSRAKLTSIPDEHAAPRQRHRVALGGGFGAGVMRRCARCYNPVGPNPPTPVPWRPP